MHALLLAEQQIPVTVVEAEGAIVRDLRASTFHPPTLDMLEPLGITDVMLKRGIPCPHWQIRLHPSGDRAVFDLSVLEGETRHPYRLQCEQWKLAEALLDKLQQSPHAQVRFASKVEGAEDAGDHVRVEIESATASARRYAPAMLSAPTAHAAPCAARWGCRSRA